MGRIERAFQRLQAEKRTGLVTYLTVGFPHPDLTPGLVAAMEEGGADLIELGIPFSDPLADGTTVQRANFAALQQGVTPRTCLEVARAVRQRGVHVPLLLMGYYNPVLAYGQEDFCRDAAAAGVDGLIVVDLPPEESDELRRVARVCGLDLICLVAPTSTDERIARMAGQASGFLYCVSLTVSPARARSCRRPSPASWNGSGATPACPWPWGSALAPAARWSTSGPTPRRWWSGVLSLTCWNAPPRARNESRCAGLWRNWRAGRPKPPR